MTFSSQEVAEVRHVLTPAEAMRQRIELLGGPVLDWIRLTQQKRPNATWQQNEITRLTLHVMQPRAAGPLDDRVDQFWVVEGSVARPEYFDFVFRDWRPTREAVTLFAAYCPTFVAAPRDPDRGPSSVAQAPATARSEPVAVSAPDSAGEWQMDFVGEMVRPELDGVEPMHQSRQKLWTMPDFDRDDVIDEIDRRWTPSETDRRRREFLDGPLREAAAALFEKHPDVPSALLVVGQYWADNANDEVHAYWVCSPDQDATFDPGWTYADLSGWWHEDPQPERWSSGLSLELFNGLGVAASLFAAYCNEHGDQNDDGWANFAAVAEFRPGAQKATYEFFGEQIRPWLNGASIYPENSYRYPHSTDSLHCEVVDS